MTGKNYHFPKDLRLLNSADFAYLKNGSKTYRTESFLCIYKKSRVMSNYSRLGLGVSRKIGNAVRRNSLKRAAREFFRQSALIPLSIDILIVPSQRGKALSLDCCLEKFRQDLNRLAEYLV